MARTVLVKRFVSRRPSFGPGSGAALELMACWSLFSFNTDMLFPPMDNATLNEATEPAALCLVYTVN